MTTTDLWVADDAGHVIVSYTGGLFGAAVHGHGFVRDMLSRGAADGEWEPTSATVTTSGDEAVRLIRALGDGFRIEGAGRVIVTAAQAAQIVDPMANYSIAYVEF
jgi:hypothetical protein